MNFFTKFLLGIGLRKTESWVAGQDILPPNNDLAIAETLGSKTARSGFALIAFAIGHLVFNWYSGTESNDALLQQISAIIGGLVIVFGRHAMTKYNLDAVRDNLLKQIGTIALVLGLLAGWPFATSSVFAQSAPSTAGSFTPPSIGAGQPAAGALSPEDNVSLLKSNLQMLATAISSQTNWVFEVHGLYAPKLQQKYGGGVGAFYPISHYVDAGLRLDWVNGGFWMPSGNATGKLPIQPFKAWPWFVVTPFGYAGVGVPLSGAKFGNFTIPGAATDNNGQATAILGYGLAISIWSSKDGVRSAYLVADRETWSGFQGQQYRGALAYNIRF